MKLKSTNNSPTNLLLWLFMMTTLFAGVVIGYSFSVPGGETIGKIIFLFVGIMLWIVANSRKKIK